MMSKSKKRQWNFRIINSVFSGQFESQGGRGSDVKESDKG